MAYRNEIRYNSVALLVGPTPSTGAHYSSGSSGVNLINPLFRIQRLTDNYDIPREDMVQLGQLQAFSLEQVNPPTPKFDFDWYLTNGVNESRMGLITDGATPCLSGIFATTTDDKNYFELISAEGVDADGDTNTQTQYVVGLGNGFITNLTFSAAVGGVAKASASIEGSNYLIYTGDSGSLPSVDPTLGQPVTTWGFSIPEPVTGQDTLSSQPTVLKYGNITANFTAVNNVVGALLNATANNLAGGAQTQAHLQSFEITVPIARDALSQLGDRYVYARKIRSPLNISCRVEAIVADLTTGNLYNYLNSCAGQTYSIEIGLNGCSGTSLVQTLGFVLSNAYLEGQDFSIGVGGRKTVRANFRTPYGNTASSTLLISGSHLGT